MRIHLRLSPGIGLSAALALPAAAAETPKRGRRAEPIAIVEGGNALDGLARFDVMAGG